MTFRKALGAVVALKFFVGAATAQMPSSSLSGFAPAAQSRPEISSLSGSTTQSLTLNLEANHLVEPDPHGSSLLGLSYNANPAPPWKLTLSELSSGPEAAKIQPGLVVTTAPEPSTVALLGLGALAMVHMLRFRNSKRLGRS
jgi:PEP-CTERM motif-containing protein